MRVSANGGTPEVLVKQQPSFLASPQMLPDGKTLLYGQVTPDMGCQIVMQSLESGERKVLFPGATLTYLSTGHIIYGVENNLFAVPFDVDTLKVAGSPVSLVQGVFRLSLFAFCGAVHSFNFFSAASMFFTILFTPLTTITFLGPINIALTRLPEASILSNFPSSVTAFVLDRNTLANKAPGSIQFFPQ
jgi:hypothetical protein